MVLLGGDSRVNSNESDATAKWGYLLAQVYRRNTSQVPRLKAGGLVSGVALHPSLISPEPDQTQLVCIAWMESV